MANKRISQLVASLALSLGICITAEAAEIKPISITLEAAAVENLQKPGSLPEPKEGNSDDSTDGSLDTSDTTSLGDDESNTTSLGDDTSNKGSTKNKSGGGDYQANSR